MGFLKFLGIALLGLVVLVAVLSFTLDGNFTVERSVVINATPAEVHPHINDFANWAAWSPFDKNDDTIVYTPGASSKGVGASRSWTSDNSGNGSQKITKTDPQAGVWMDLDLDGQPAEVAFLFEPVEGGTKVTWHDQFEMEGAMKVVGVVLVPMLLAPMFDQGLGDLKSVVEGT